MKFILFVEGETEKETIADFLKRWLDSRIDKRVGIQTVRFVGCNHLVKEAGKKASIHLNGPKASQIIAVISLLDLYGPYNFYPEYLHSARERFQWAKEHLERQVNHPKYRVFFAVHELEAWLLSDKSIFPAEIRKALPGKQPEEINFNEPPAKLLDRLYREKTKSGYKKTVDGYSLFKALSPETAYKACPCLQQMLDEMLDMARAAGQ